MASTYLEKTFSGNGTNANKWTFSAWLKRSSLAPARIITAGTSTRDGLIFNGGEKLQFFVGSNSTEVNAFITNRRFRDTNAWYHIVVSADSTQSGSSNQVKLYVNGELDTSYEESASVDSNLTWHLGNGIRHRIGTDSDSSLDNYFDGSMSHIHFCDGYVYDADDFGETDSTTGEWKIKTSPSVTYGTNGFFILKDGNSVTDQSGNSNNFTVAGGTLTKTEDCPSNVFATFNPLVRNKSYNDGSLTNGNTGYAPNGRSIACTTLGVTSGKYYAEFKATDAGALYIGAGLMSGITSQGQTNPIWYDNSTSYAIGYGANGSLQYNTTSSTYGSGYSDNDIVGIALDMDNKEMYISVNGTWQNSGDPTSGSSKTGGVTGVTSYNPFDDGDEVFLFVSDFSAAGVGECQANFGNGYFGTTAVSSAGTNASGNGIFEYDVPTGYTALSTKGLNL
jgi:hypothetical protein